MDSETEAGAPEISTALEAYDAVTSCIHNCRDTLEFIRIGFDNGALPSAMDVLDRVLEKQLAEIDRLPAALKLLDATRKGGAR
jgi:hypothetical protein